MPPPPLLADLLQLPELCASLLGLLAPVELCRLR
jgi:hypothetical protein